MPTPRCQRCWNLLTRILKQPILKMLQGAITNMLETNGKKKSLDEEKADIQNRQMEILEWKIQ